MSHTHRYVHTKTELCPTCDGIRKTIYQCSCFETQESTFSCKCDRPSTGGKHRRR